MGENANKSHKILPIRKFSVPYSLFAALYIIILGLFVLAALFKNQPNELLSPFIVLAYVAVAVLVLYFALNYIAKLPMPENRTTNIVLVVMLLLMYAVQILIVLRLVSFIDLGQNLARPFVDAARYVQQGQRPEDYLLQKQGGVGAYSLWVGYLYIMNNLGIKNLVIPAVVLGIFAIDFSIYIICKIVRESMGNLHALICMVLCTFTLPYVLYGLVLRSEVLAMPFVCAIALLWTRARRAWGGETPGEVYLRFALLGLLAAFGALVHIAVLIVWVVVCFDLVFALRGGRRFAVLALGAVVTMGVYIGLGYYIGHSVLLPKYNDEQVALPYAAHLLQQIDPEGYGNDENIAHLLEEESPAKKNKAANDMLKEFIGGNTFTENMSIFIKRLATPYSDGLLGLQDGFVQHPKGSQTPAFITQPGTLSYRVFMHIAFASFGAGAIVSLFGAAQAAKRKNNYFSFIRGGVAVYSLFLLFWPQATSASLLVILPFFTMLVLEVAAPKPASHIEKEAVVPLSEDSRAETMRKLLKYKETGFASETVGGDTAEFPAINPYLKGEAKPRMTETGWFRKIESEPPLTEQNAAAFEKRVELPKYNPPKGTAPPKEYSMSTVQNTYKEETAAVRNVEPARTFGFQHSPPLAHSAQQKNAPPPNNFRVDTPATPPESKQSHTEWSKHIYPLQDSAPQRGQQTVPHWQAANSPASTVQKNSQDLKREKPSAQDREYNRQYQPTSPLQKEDRSANKQKEKPPIYLSRDYSNNKLEQPQDIGSGLKSEE